MPRHSKNMKNRHHEDYDLDSDSQYGGLDILSSTVGPTTTNYKSSYNYPFSPVVSYNPFSYKTNVPIGIDYLIKKNYLAPSNPYYPDGSISVTNYDDISTVVSSEDEFGNIKNTIITKPIFRDPYDSSFITSWLPDYIHPMLSTYRDLNSDPVMRKKITKYYVTHFLDHWINRDMSDLLNYLQVNSSGDVSLIKSLNDYDSKLSMKDNGKDIDQKIKFLEKFIITYDMVYKILAKYVRETGINWVNLPSQKNHIKKLIAKKAIKMLKNAINEIRH